MNSNNKMRAQTRAFIKALNKRKLFRPFNFIQLSPKPGSKLVSYISIRRKNVPPLYPKKTSDMNRCVNKKV